MHAARVSWPTLPLELPSSVLLDVVCGLVGHAIVHGEWPKPKATALSDALSLSLPPPLGAVSPPRLFARNFQNFQGRRGGPAGNTANVVIPLGLADPPPSVHSPFSGHFRLMIFTSHAAEGRQDIRSRAKHPTRREKICVKASPRGGSGCKPPPAHPPCLSSRPRLGPTVLTQALAHVRAGTHPPVRPPRILSRPAGYTPRSGRVG